MRRRKRKKIIESEKNFIRIRPEYDTEEEYETQSEDESECESEDQSEDKSEDKSKDKSKDKLGKCDRITINSIMNNCIEKLFKYVIDRKYNVKLKQLDYGNYNITRKNKIIGSISLKMNKTDL